MNSRLADRSAPHPTLHRDCGRRSNVCVAPLSKAGARVAAEAWAVHGRKTQACSHGCQYARAGVGQQQLALVMRIDALATCCMATVRNNGSAAEGRTPLSRNHGHPIRRVAATAAATTHRAPAVAVVEAAPAVRHQRTHLKFSEAALATSYPEQ